MDNKLDKTALTWGNIANKPTNLATSENVAKAQSAANSAVSMASGATATANSAKSAATSAVGVANTANTTANSALSKANSAVSVASQANSNASSAVSIANSANNSASSAVNTANQAKSTADSVNSKVTEIQSNGGGRNLLTGTSGDWITKTASGWMLVTTADSTKTSVADYHTGDSFTYSETVTNKSNSDVRLEMYCCDNNGNRLNGDSHHVLSDFVAPNTNAKRISCTITIDSNTWYVEHTLIADGTSDAKTVQIKGEMFEYGTIAHDWQPALEDIQSQIDANKTAAANAQTSANNAQNTANSAQSTANTAIKVSETLKDLGNYTATASGTSDNSTYSGLPRTNGVSMSEVYDNGYPVPYGNVLNVAGVGAGQLLLGWSGTSSANEHLYYRSHRDNGSGGWSTWDKIAYVSDLTWSNISGKPDVATKADVSSGSQYGKVYCWQCIKQS